MPYCIFLTSRVGKFSRKCWNTLWWLLSQFHSKNIPSSERILTDKRLVAIFFKFSTQTMGVFIFSYLTMFYELKLSFNRTQYIIGKELSEEQDIPILRLFKSIHFFKDYTHPLDYRYGCTNYNLPWYHDSPEKEYAYYHPYHIHSLSRRFAYNTTFIYQAGWYEPSLDNNAWYYSNLNEDLGNGDYSGIDLRWRWPHLNVYDFFDRYGYEDNKGVNLLFWNPRDQESVSVPFFVPERDSLRRGPETASIAALIRCNCHWENEFIKNNTYADDSFDLVIPTVNLIDINEQEYIDSFYLGMQLRKDQFRLGLFRESTSYFYF